MKSSKKRISFSLLAAVVAASLIVGCNGGGGDAGNAPAPDKGGATKPAAGGGEALQGAGSTFINPIMLHWMDDYKKADNADVSYESIGSGGGIKNLIGKTVSFAGSDAPMNDSETKDAKDAVLHFPAVIGAEAIAYNVDGVPSGLHLSGPVIADIFLGNIKSWNDPKIVALNPSAKLPDTPIFTVHRSDGSGTTYIFTDYLSAISPDWKTKVGKGKSVQWPAASGIGAKGNEGVTGVLAQHKGSIAYVELAYAIQNKIPYAQVQNASGAFVDPSSDSASAAADGVTIPDDMKVSIVNTNNPKGYPITGFSYIIVYQKPDRADDIKKFLKYVLGDGQKECTPLSYGPVPDAVVQRELKMIDTIQ